MTTAEGRLHQKYMLKEDGGDEETTLRRAGLNALELYTPRHSASAKGLEEEHGVAGKYTVGLMMRQFCGPDHDEDPVSFALTALSRMVARNNLKWEDIGMVQVGSESLIDRAKSIKSNLMALFEEYDVFDVEGTDMYNACYGGTAALLTCLNWVQSYNWDGRWAVAIATDIADAPPQYRFMVGAAACAMLVGPDAAIQLQRERCTHIIDRWDFYKPIGWDSMAPIVDGPGSVDVYFSCMDACQRQLTQRVGYGNAIEDHDYLIYHLGSGPKFVKHCFERSCANHYGDPMEGKKKGRRTECMSKHMQDELFETKTTPSLVLASRIGPMHTVSTYTAVNSLLIERKDTIVGKNWLVFSYGSGAASTIFRLKVDHLPTIMWDKHADLDKRLVHNAKTFDTLCSRYANTYAKFGWKADLQTKGDYQFAATYYLTECDKWGRRAYALIADPNFKMQGPVIIGIPDVEPVEGDPELYKIFGKDGLPPLPDPDPEPEEVVPQQQQAPAANGSAEQQLANMDPAQQQQLAGLLQLLQQAQAPQPAQ